MHNKASASVADWTSSANLLSNAHHPSSLNIFTQNAFGLPFTRRKRRFRALCALIRRLNPDVVFLQEVMVAGDERFFRIDGYHLAYVPHGLVNSGGLLTLSRVPLTRVRFTRFESQGCWYNRQVTDRVIGKGWLEADAADWGVTLVNTHLVSTYIESAEFVYDAGQLAQLKQLLRAVEWMGPAVVAGDFNFLEGCPFHRLVAEVMEDVSMGLGPEPDDDLQPAVDHVFVRSLEWREGYVRRIAPRILGILGVQREPSISDHAGISVELDLGAN